MSWSCVSATSADTYEVGRRLGRAARAGDVILIEGELGVGKTVLVQGVAAGIGAREPPISPTFVLVRHYPGPLELVHADLYRLQSRTEVEDLDLLELAEGGVLAVEWADRAPWLDPGAAARLALSASKEARVVTLLGGPEHLVAAFVAPPA